MHWSASLNLTSQIMDRTGHELTPICLSTPPQCFSTSLPRILSHIHSAGSTLERIFSIVAHITTRRYTVAVESSSRMLDTRLWGSITTSQWRQGLLEEHTGFFLTPSQADGHHQVEYWGINTPTLNRVFYAPQGNRSNKSVIVFNVVISTCLRIKYNKL